MFYGVTEQKATVSSPGWHGDAMRCNSCFVINARATVSKSREKVAERQRGKSI